MAPPAKVWTFLANVSTMVPKVNSTTARGKISIQPNMSDNRATVGLYRRGHDSEDDIDRRQQGMVLVGGGRVRGRTRIGSAGPGRKHN
jgi:hypothetical protein